MTFVSAVKCGRRCLVNLCVLVVCGNLLGRRVNQEPGRTTYILYTTQNVALCVDPYFTSVSIAMRLIRFDRYIYTGYRYTSKYNIIYWGVYEFILVYYQVVKL